MCIRVKCDTLHLYISKESDRPPPAGLNLIGGTVNSLTGTLTPMLVGSLIGIVSAQTKIENVNVVLYIAMAVFAATFIILRLLPINNPEMQEEDTHLEKTPWSFRNFKFGAIAIFLYVGAEVGIPGTMFFYISDTSANGSCWLSPSAICSTSILTPSIYT